MERDCPVCNVKYEADPKRLKFGRQTTCSRKCSYIFRANQLNKQIECNCGTCGKVFDRPQSHTITKHGKVFCSTHCLYSARTKNIIPRIVNAPYNIIRKTEEEKKSSRKKWKEINKDKLRKQAADKARERRKIDPLYALRNNLSRRIRENLTNGYKSESTRKIIGCSIEELKLYLESKFIDGMSWDNYGKWHLDHIIPISLAKTNEEVYQLNHYTNFQPLWMEDNLKKSNKIIS